jgi:hypothetical protein
MGIGSASEPLTSQARFLGMRFASSELSLYPDDRGRKLLTDNTCNAVGIVQ